MKPKWKIIKKISKGGNGTVYEVKDAHGNHFAMKKLDKINGGKAYNRFKSEVKILTRLKKQNGVIQIIDYYLPSHISVQSKPYYVMPLGVTFSEFIKDKTDEQFYNLFFKLSRTLVELHNLGITHRDIKPDNILVVNGEPVFSDFGLANFPKKIKISNPREKIGPKWTIAPEMERISSTAEFKKADIYSFAKTLWILITKQWWGFEGQYIPNSSISIDKYVHMMINEMSSLDVWYYHSIVILNRLLVDSTDNDPNNRPDAKFFNDRLQYWYDSCYEYFERNPYEWEDALKRIFPISIPNNSVWNNIKDMVNVLKIVCEDYDNLNHSFYPESGGMDWEKVALSPDKEYLIINDDLYLKPKCLIFEFLGDLDWSYFRLELEPITPLASNPTEDYYEDIFIDEDMHLTEDEGEESHSIRRVLKGTFVITKKTSMINRVKDKYNAYTGWQNKITNDAYKSELKVIKKLVESNKLYVRPINKKVPVSL